MYALKAPESKRQYPKRLKVFLDFLKIDGLTIEEKANKFYDAIVGDDNGGGREWLESQLIEFFTLQNSRVEKGEISAGTSYCFVIIVKKKPFILSILYLIIMAKFVEMDERVKFKEQIEEKEIDGQVILINKFNVDPNKVEQFVNDWGKDAINFKQQPGFISAQLHKGIGKSSVLINYAVWESLEHYKNAVNKILFSSESQSPLLKYDDNSLVMSPHLFKKIAVPGICEN